MTLVLKPEWLHKKQTEINNIIKFNSQSNQYCDCFFFNN